MIIDMYFISPVDRPLAMTLFMSYGYSAPGSLNLVYPFNDGLVKNPHALWSATKHNNMYLFILLRYLLYFHSNSSF